MPPSVWGEVFLVLGMVVGVMALPQPTFPSFPSSAVTFGRERRQPEDISDELVSCLLLNEGNESHCIPPNPSSTPIPVKQEHTSNKTPLCTLKAAVKAMDESFCNNFSPSFSSLKLESMSKDSLLCVLKTAFAGTDETICKPSFPSFPSSSATLVDHLNDEILLCLLNANDQGRDGSSCTSSPLPQPKGPNPLPESNPDVVRAPSCDCVPYWQCKDDDVSKPEAEGGSLSPFVLDLRSNLGCDGDPQKVCCVLADFSVPPPTPPPVSPLCGERNDSTIFGFEDEQSRFGEFPWTAAIVSARGFGPSESPLYAAAGSLIHPQVVLSAAHSVLIFTADQLMVRLGEWNMAEKTEAVPHQEIRVKEVLFHPDYHKVKQHYDVALLVLDQPAVLGATVNTICLPSKLQDYVSDDCVVSGWGKKDLDEKSRFQRVMKKVSLPVMDHAQCQAALRGTRLGPRFNLHDSFLCAGGQEEGQNACKGDGGSPLACRLQSDARRYVQVGVVAWGVACGSIGVPVVYADVLKARPWIDQVINEKTEIPDSNFSS